ncbi:MAG: DUF1501 domain-containing protein, partial [Planctomycetota bacterium]
MENPLRHSLHQLSPKVSRHDLLRVGALSMAGVALSDLFAHAATAAQQEKHGPGFGRAKNCIILFLSGGNPQHDMFDPKPDTPAEIRGEFQTIETTVPGIRFGEHCQHSAKHMHQMALVRSMHHDHNDHARAGYWMFTGEKYPRSLNDANSMS